MHLRLDCICCSGFVTGQGNRLQFCKILRNKCKVKRKPFCKSGYTFAGWYLSRKSDGKTLYFDLEGTARWYIPGSQPDGYYAALSTLSCMAADMAINDSDGRINILNVIAILNLM